MGSNLPPDPGATPTLSGAGAVNASAPSTTPPGTSQTASADSAVSSNAPPAKAPEIQIIKVDPIKRNNSIFSNPLDKFIDVTYGISLSMVHADSVDKISTNSVNALTAAGDIPGITADNYIVFASTGDARTPSSRPNMYNIQGLIFKSVVGHLPQNPMTAVMYDVVMRLYEPHGFSLREDLELIRQACGYDSRLEQSNYVYRMEIWFSGWDPQTGQWTQNIPFPLTDSINLTSVIYYVSIMTIEATVTTQGANYVISIAPMSHRTMRAESLIYRLQENQVPKADYGTATNQPNAAQPPNLVLTAKNAATFGAAIKHITDSIATQIKHDTQSGTFPGLTIFYNVTGPSWLMDQPLLADTNLAIKSSHGSVSFDATSGQYTYAGQDVDILTVIHQIMDQIELVRRLWTREDDPEFQYPSVTWNMRSDIEYTGHDPDIRMNGYNGYTFNYYIEPVLSFRSRTTVSDTRNDRVATDNQQKRVARMLDYGMLLRVYDFFFTNDNSEVIDLELKLSAYYQEPVPSGVSTIRSESAAGNNADYADEQAKKMARLLGQAHAPLIQFAPATSQSLENVLGISANPQSATSVNITPAHKHQGMRRQQYPTQSQSYDANQAAPDVALYQYAKQQYFRYDLIDLNMTVRFDPLWLLNPYMANGDFTPRLTGTSPLTKVIYTNMDRVILLRAPAPVQRDFMNPYRANASSNNFDVLSGFYQVLFVINEFDGGKFHQKLNLFKYPALMGCSSLATNSTPTTQNQPSTGPAPAPTAAQPSNLSPDPTVGTGGL
jgi:hypothetical protein